MSAVANAVENGHSNGKTYLNETYGIKSWLFTLDHKRIGILYLITLAAFFCGWRCFRQPSSD